MPHFERQRASRPGEVEDLTQKFESSSGKGPLVKMIMPLKLFRNLFVRKSPSQGKPQSFSDNDEDAKALVKREKEVDAFREAWDELESWRRSRDDTDNGLKAYLEDSRMWASLGIFNPRQKVLSKYGIRKRRRLEGRRKKIIPSVKNGTALGNYQFLDMIGIGGFGEVYRAKGLQINREVAVKIYTVSNETVLDVFRRGANLLSQLNHNNIVTVYDFYVSEGYALLVMELLKPQDTLRSYVGNFINKGRILDFITIFTSLVSAMRYCHQSKFQDTDGQYKVGIYHGDIKPDNIFLNGGRIKIADFMIPNLEVFLSRGKDEELFPQYDTSRYGTPMYMSPEQWHGLVNEQTDIYNIGVTAFELLTGFYPYETKYDYSDGKFQRPERFNPYSPDGLNNIILKCIEHDTSKRYAHVSELERDLIAVSSEISSLESGSRNSFYGPTMYINKPTSRMRFENLQNTEINKESKIMAENFVFHGSTTFINKPIDTVIQDFQNSYAVGDNSDLERINSEILVLIKLVLESGYLPVEAKEETTRALHSVATEVKEEKRNQVTLKGTLDSIKDVVSKAADIATPALTTINTILKLTGLS